MEINKEGVSILAMRANAYAFRFWGSRVRIPLKSLFFVSFVCYVVSGFCDGMITGSEETYTMCVCVCVCVCVCQIASDT